MKRENIGDSVLAEVVSQFNQVSDHIAMTWKGVKPFAKKEIPAKERLYWYDQLTMADMNMLIQKHGEDKISKFIYENERLRDRTGAKQNASQGQEG